MHWPRVELRRKRLSKLRCPKKGLDSPRDSAIIGPCRSTCDYPVWRELLPYVESYRCELHKLLHASLNFIKFCNSNKYIPTLESDILYRLTRKLAPRTYLEIGCGNSTTSARQAIINRRLITGVFLIDPPPGEQITQYVDVVHSKRV